MQLKYDCLGNSLHLYYNYPTCDHNCSSIKIQQHANCNTIHIIKKQLRNSRQTNNGCECIVRISKTTNSPPILYRLLLTLCINFFFWFFAVSDGFFTADAVFFVGFGDFIWTSTIFSYNSTIFFATSTPLVCLSSCLDCI
jgi:hypothetical protein